MQCTQVKLRVDAQGVNRVLAHDRLMDPFSVLAHRASTRVLADDRLMDLFACYALRVNRVLAYDG